MRTGKGAPAHGTLALQPAAHGRSPVGICHLFRLIGGYDGVLSVLCSAMGVLARGPDLRAKVLFDDSREYCCRALSKTGLDTVKPFRI